MNFNDLKVKIFADGADISAMQDLHAQGFISGFTTNPSLMKKAGIKDYESFAKNALGSFPDMPISFEVFADEFNEIKDQALKIASWGKNVVVKIPVSNTKGETSYDLIQELSLQNIKLNVTAIFTEEQIKNTYQALKEGPYGNISIFAGRIFDAGEDALKIMKEAVELTKNDDHIELIWASPRQVYDMVLASELGVDIITVTPDLLSKKSLLGKNLEDYSIETVKMFFDDAQSNKYSI